MGWCLLVSGTVFLLLSACKKMTDEELQRATSIYGETIRTKARNQGKKFAVDHKDEIAQAAIDNRGVIASVAADHQDSVVNAAFMN